MTTDLSFTVPRTDLRKALNIAKEICEQIGAQRIDHDEDIAKVSAVGIGMKSHSGIAARMAVLYSLKPHRGGKNDS